jgi:hypothetical protein
MKFVNIGPDRIETLFISAFVSDYNYCLFNVFPSPILHLKSLSKISSFFHPMEIFGLVSILHTVLLIVTRQSLWGIFSIVAYAPIIYQRTLDPIDYPFENQLHLFYHSINSYTAFSVFAHLFSLYCQTGFDTFLEYPQGYFQID